MVEELTGQDSTGLTPPRAAKPPVLRRVSKRVRRGAEECLRGVSTDGLMFVEAQRVSTHTGDVHRTLITSVASNGTKQINVDGSWK